MSTTAAVVIPAAGGGRRLGGVFKPFMELAGEPVLRRALQPFLTDARVTRVIIALPAELVTRPPDWLADLAPRVVVVEGGRERGDSVRSGLAALPEDADVVLVHDAARPLVSADLVRKCIDAAAAGRSVIAAVPATDTIQQVDGDLHIVGTPERARLWHAQTPQAFPRDVIIAAYERAAATGNEATDDAALVRAAGGIVDVIEGDRRNIKLTVPDDLVIAEALLRSTG